MDPFERAALALPADQRCIQSSPGRWDLPLGEVYLGVPPSDFFGWTPLERVPEAATGFHVYLGAESGPLVEALAASTWAPRVRMLSIGNSSYGQGRGRDFTRSAAALATTDWPRLARLYFGLDALFCNQHCLYGTLGDVTPLLARMPSLVELELSGLFELTAAPRLPRLTSLKVALDDPTLGINDGPISDATLAHLLAADCPALEELDLDLACSEQTAGYRLPHRRAVGAAMPALRTMSVTGRFAPGERKKLRDSPLARRRGTSVSTAEMVEAD